MPSPSLDGTFNNLIEKYKDKNFRFTCTIEGVRGCPYRCTFCEIGSLYFQKLQRQSFNKLKKEIEWMSENKVVYIDNADSNFGLFEDWDLKVAKLLVYLKYAGVISPLLPPVLVHTLAPAVASVQI